MKIKLMAAVAALALSPSIGIATAQPRVPAASVVIVDTDRIYRECTACRAAQAQIQTQITALQQRAAQLGQPIETELQSIQQAAAAARNQTGAARTTAETALQTRIQRLEQQRTTAQQELARSEQNLRSIQQNVLQQINARMNPIISQVMTARGANLAVDTNATLAHSAALNVTDQVLQSLNQQLPSVSVTPLPQTAAPAPATPPTTPRPSGR
jgi:Skp family chaperone for outer membrane proteins